jgi:hypothetical protein
MNILQTWKLERTDKIMKKKSKHKNGQEKRNRQAQAAKEK